MEGFPFGSSKRLQGVVKGFNAASGAAWFKRRALYQIVAGSASVIVQVGLRLIEDYAKIVHGSVPKQCSRL